MRSDMPNDSERDGAHDFDFQTGHWRIRNERLKKRLQGCTEWETFEATQEASWLRSAVNHVLGFWTWHSLAVDEGCSPDEAANLAVGFVLSARRGQVS